MVKLTDGDFELDTDLEGRGNGSYIIRSMKLTNTASGHVYTWRPPPGYGYIDARKLRPYYSYNLVSSTSPVSALIRLIVEVDLYVNEISFRFDIEVGSRIGLMFFVSKNVYQWGAASPRLDGE